MPPSASALFRRHWLDTLLLLVPASLALEAYGGDPLWVFGAAGSSLQIALFVAPVLLFASHLFGTPMDLVFTPFEVFSVVLAVLAVNHIASDGECNWMEGVQLLAVYLILGLAFYFLPATP